MIEVAGNSAQLLLPMLQVLLVIIVVSLTQIEQHSRQGK